MGAKVEDTTIFIKDILSSITVMDIKIDNKNFLKPFSWAYLAVIAIL